MIAEKGFVFGLTKSIPVVSSLSPVWRWRASHVMLSRLLLPSQSCATLASAEETRRVNLSSCKSAPFGAAPRILPLPSCRVQPAEKSPSHPNHVQVQTQLQPWGEPHRPHSCLRQPGNAHVHAAWMMANQHKPGLHLNSFSLIFLIWFLSGFLLISRSE